MKMETEKMSNSDISHNHIDMLLVRTLRTFPYSKARSALCSISVNTSLALDWISTVAVRACIFK